MASPVVLITGASRGIGKQLAVDFAAKGYDVVALARSTADSPTKLPGTVDETAELVRAHGQQCLPIGVDLQAEDQILAAAERAYDELGRVDVLINNAAIAPPGNSLEAPTRRWRLAVEINVNAPFYLGGDARLGVESARPRVTDASSSRKISGGKACMASMIRCDKMSNLPPT